MQHFSGKSIQKLQYLPLSEQPLYIHLVSCIIKKFVSLKRKSRSRECDAIFPSSLPDQVSKFFSDGGGGKKFSDAMLHAMHLTIHYMATAVSSGNSLEFVTTPYSPSLVHYSTFALTLNSK